MVAACFIIDLPDLGGAAKLRKLDVPVRTLVSVRGALAQTSPRGRHRPQQQATPLQQHAQFEIPEA